MKINEKNRISSQNAKIFIKAIKTIALKPDNLDNLETYLSYHFTEWLEKWYGR